MGKRFRIAFLEANVMDKFSNEIVKGAMKAAQDCDVDMSIFPVKYVNHDTRQDVDALFEYQYNALLSLVAPAGFDYVVISIGAIGYACDLNKKKEILQMFGDTPVLCICDEIPGYEFVRYENSTGIHGAIDYLVKKGRKHICMMVGDSDNVDCQERYKAYRDALEKNQMPYEPCYARRCELAGRDDGQIDALLDENPQVDAIICATDMIAAAVCKRIKERNMRVGEDVAVVGFDDLPFAAQSNPPLASIRADAKQLGYRSVQRAVDILKGCDDGKRFLQSSFVERESCMYECDRRNDEKEPVEHSFLATGEESKRLFDYAHNTNLVIRESLMFSDDLKEGYANVLSKLYALDLKTSYLYLLHEPMVYRNGEIFPQTVQWKFKAHQEGVHAFAVSEEQQNVKMDFLFDNAFIKDDERHTFIVVDLYSREYQYGVLICEIQSEDFLMNWEFVVYQMSAAVKMVGLLNTQNRMLEELHMKNLSLEEESKMDELTELYNRRGFYEAANKLITAESNVGKEWIICYADMDRLKNINDTYGHIEGDYSLKVLSECLRCVLGKRAIIGRVGGDEFVALLCKDEGLDRETILKCKEEWLNHFNEQSVKPYHIDMSVGVYEGKCQNSYDLKDAIDKADDILYTIKVKRNVNR